MNTNPFREMQEELIDLMLRVSETEKAKAAHFDPHFVLWLLANPEYISNPYEEDERTLSMVESDSWRSPKGWREYQQHRKDNGMEPTRRGFQPDKGCVPDYLKRRQPRAYTLNPEGD